MRLALTTAPTPRVPAGELGPASILEAQLRMLDGSMRPQSRFLSPASPGFNPYTRVMSPGKERMPPSPRPHTALGPVGDIDISDWGPSALDMDPLDDTLRYESLLVDEAMRVFAMERAERVAQAGAVPYLISLCCGPEVSSMTWRARDGRLGAPGSIS